MGGIFKSTTDESLQHVESMICSSNFDLFSFQSKRGNVLLPCPPSTVTTIAVETRSHVWGMEIAQEKQNAASMDADKSADSPSSVSEYLYFYRLKVNMQWDNIEGVVGQFDSIFSLLSSIQFSSDLSLVDFTWIMYFC